MPEYFVRNGGNDNNNGLSIANAWATVGKVSGFQFSPLDVIQFKSGDVWRERFTITPAHSGLNEDNQVLFTSYGLGSRPIISGAEIEENWTREDDYFYASNYVNNPGVVVKDGWLLKRRENYFALDDDDAWWYDAENNRVYIRFDPAGKTMEIGNYPRRWTMYVNPGVHDVIIDNICTRDGCRGTYVRNETDNITLQNLTVKNLADWGVNISPRTNLLDCNISYIHDPGVKQAGTSGEDASGYRIAGNEISWCGYYMCSYCQGSAIVYGFSNVIIEDNDIHHCGLGYTQSWGMDHGLKLGCEGGIVRNNKVHHNTAGIGIIAGASNMNVHHNLVWGNGVGISHGYVTTGCRINNNVIFKNQVAHSDSCGFLINDGVVAEFKNNILFKNGNPPYSKQIWVRMGGSDDILDSDYNLIYGPDDPNVDICTRVSTGFTWAEWKAAGYDFHSKNIPYHGMINPDNGDFNLMPASPCINAGVDVGLKFDFDGTAIPQGINPDIGAYEYKQNGGGISMAIIKLIITEIPSFEVIAIPGERIVEKGGQSFYTITLDTVGSFDKAVALTVNNIPDSVMATFSQATIRPNESSVLTVQVGTDAIAGEYDLEVIGTEN